MEVTTTPMPPEAFLTDEQRWNYMWWFHEFDANCDGTLDKEEYRIWTKSLPASVGVDVASLVGPLHGNSFLLNIIHAYT